MATTVNVPSDTTDSAITLGKPTTQFSTGATTQMQSLLSEMETTRFTSARIIRGTLLLSAMEMIRFIPDRTTPMRRLLSALEILLSTIRGQMTPVTQTSPTAKATSPGT